LDSKISQTQKKRIWDVCKHW